MVAQPPSLEELASRELLINRELSWLEFNARVLEEARDPSVPLLERLKFHCIFSSNLDEFYMVRVAGLRQQELATIVEPSADGMTTQAQLEAIAARTHDLVETQYTDFRKQIVPGLKAAGIELLRPKHLKPEEQAFVSKYFHDEVFPVLTPLAVDPGHPFPHLANRSLNCAITLKKRKRAQPAGILGIVQVPSVLPRLLQLPGPGARRLLLLEDVIAMHVAELFPDSAPTQCHPFRVTRDSDIDVDEDEAVDLLQAIQKELKRRDRGVAVRLEVAHDADLLVVESLCAAVRMSPRDVFRVAGPLNLPDFMQVTSDERKELHDEPFAPQFEPRLAGNDSTFDIVRAGDVLLHHPYDSFQPVIEFIEDAASDPGVLAIKQTLYRTGSDSPIVKALQKAAENGKQVTALVELRARFDEASNIRWAQKLEETGVHVVYGVLGLKTHCKAALVVRREPTGLRRYVHLSTGNYNPTTARLYTDCSLLSADPALGEDVGALFNFLTANSLPAQWKKLAIAPLKLRDRVIELIEREASFGPRGRLVCKLNALVDSTVIHALYKASTAGVQIDLLVRGICCLRPGVKGVSERIRVIKVVDRFLEHPRVLYFENGGKPEVYLSSADWMPRNFQRRVEVLFPIEAPELRERLMHEVLGVALADNCKASVLGPDGQYQRVQPRPGEALLRSQQRFLEIARVRAAGGDVTSLRMPLPGVAGRTALQARPPRLSTSAPIPPSAGAVPAGPAAPTPPTTAAPVGPALPEAPTVPPQPSITLKN